MWNGITIFFSTGSSSVLYVGWSLHGERGVHHRASWPTSLLPGRREGGDKTCKTWKHFYADTKSHCKSHHGGRIGTVSLRGYIPGAYLYGGRLRTGLVDIIFSVSNIGRIKKGAHWQVSDAEPRSACDAAYALEEPRRAARGGDGHNQAPL